MRSLPGADENVGESAFRIGDCACRPIQRVGRFWLSDLKLGWFPAVTEKKASLKGRKPPEGDKRQFLLSIEAEVIKEIKVTALQTDTTASAIMEEAAKQWLERRKSVRTKKA